MGPKSKNSRNRKASQQEQAPPVPDAPGRSISRLFEIPQSALSGIPQIELSGNREAVVDGCQGVLEYDENLIKLSAGKMSIKFTGRGLQIRALTHDSAVVEGFITAIEFLT